MKVILFRLFVYQTKQGVHDTINHQSTTVYKLIANSFGVITESA